MCWAPLCRDPEDQDILNALLCGRVHANKPFGDLLPPIIHREFSLELVKLSASSSLHSKLGNKTVVNKLCTNLPQLPLSLLKILARPPHLQWCKTILANKTFNVWSFFPLPFPQRVFGVEPVSGRSVCR